MAAQTRTKILKVPTLAESAFQRFSHSASTTIRIYPVSSFSFSFFLPLILLHHHPHPCHPHSSASARTCNVSTHKSVRQDLCLVSFLFFFCFFSVFFLFLFTVIRVLTPTRQHATHPHAHAAQICVPGFVFSKFPFFLSIFFSFLLLQSSASAHQHFRTQRICTHTQYIHVCLQVNFFSFLFFFTLICVCTQSIRTHMQSIRVPTRPRPPSASTCTTSVHCVHHLSKLFSFLFGFFCLH